MRTVVTLLAYLCIASVSYSQTNVVHTTHSYGHAGQPLGTADLLREVQWDSLRILCHQKQSTCTASESHVGSAVYYEYQQQGNRTHFYIMSFNGFVVEYSNKILEGSKEIEVQYFDKALWLEFAHHSLPGLPDSLKLTVIEPKSILKAYYSLLGVGTSNVYGWMCEYSTVGLAPPRRQAAITMLSDPDKLKPLLTYPDLYVQLYAADALISSDISARTFMASLPLESSDSAESQLRSQLLTRQQWGFIYALRDSDQKVRVCGFSGANEVEQSSTTEILSDESIRQIPERYKELRKIGYK